MTSNVEEYINLYLTLDFSKQLDPNDLSQEELQAKLDQLWYYI